MALDELESESDFNFRLSPSDELDLSSFDFFGMAPVIMVRSCWVFSPPEGFVVVLYFCSYILFISLRFHWSDVFYKEREKV